MVARERLPHARQRGTQGLRHGLRQDWPSDLLGRGLARGVPILGPSECRDWCDDRLLLQPATVTDLRSVPVLAVICPTFWTSADGDPIGLAHNPECEELYLDNLIVSRAFENECAVVFVNAGGPAKDAFIGRSGVTLPFLGKVGGTVRQS